MLNDNTCQNHNVTLNATYLKSTSKFVAVVKRQLWAADEKKHLLHEMFDYAIVTRLNVAVVTVLTKQALKKFVGTSFVVHLNLNRTLLTGKKFLGIEHVGHLPSLVPCPSTIHLPSLISSLVPGPAQVWSSHPLALDGPNGSW